MTILGDINGDGKIDGTDLAIIRGIVQGYINQEEFQEDYPDAYEAADIAGNYDITVDDFNTLEAHINGVQMLNEVV